MKSLQCNYGGHKNYDFCSCSKSNYSSTMDSRRSNGRFHLLKDTKSITELLKLWANAHGILYWATVSIEIIHFAHQIANGFFAKFLLVSSSSWHSNTPFFNLPFHVIRNVSASSGIWSRDPSFCSSLSSPSNQLDMLKSSIKLSFDKCTIRF